LQSGTEGFADERVYAPGMRFPLETAPAYPNSQVYMAGGSHGGGGGQCDAGNYSYPWWDNYCEPRRWDVPMCPGGTGHQGQDIRPSTCADKQHWAVAAEDGVITHIGSYSVYVTTDSGRRHRYLHMAPETVPVRQGQRVRRGDRVGKVSNAYFDSNGNRVGTTIHLHYDLYMPVAQFGRSVYVSPYMSLVRSYEELLGAPGETCEAIPPQGATVDEQGPCAQRWGSEQYWRFVDGAGQGGSYFWTNAFVNETPSNWARWNLNFEEAGNYAVEVHVVAPHNRAERIPYLIRHAGRDERIRVSQNGREGWLRLGVYGFAAGDDQKVELYDNSGEEGANLHVTYDALRVVRVREPEPPPPAPDAGPAPPVDSGVVPDLGVSTDAGANDVQPLGDAGLVAADANSEVDAGPAPVPDSGCGCGATPLSSWVLWLALPLLRRRRR
jgi:murein DD-endopeptidase MepM/ murein hydrolase activator NlpD